MISAYFKIGSGEFNFEIAKVADTLTLTILSNTMDSGLANDEEE